MGVSPLGCQQFHMRATLNDMPSIEHHDFMRIHHGGQTMSNDQGGFVVGRIAQFGLNRALVAAVQSGGGFIKNQNWRVLQQGSGNGHALLFTA